MKIRTAKPDDAGSLAAIGITVWTTTYALEGVRDAFAEYMFSEFSCANMDALIRQQLVLVAELEGHLVGYTVIARAEAEKSELQTLYVLPRFQRSGAGKRLAEEALNRQPHGLWLTCWHQNDQALNFYQKNGFSVTGEDWFELEGEKHLNYVLEKSK